MPDRYRLGAEIRPECRKHPDRVIAELVERQHGVVARWQLLDAGLGQRAIAHRRNIGRLHVIHRGVYSVGHRSLTADARWIAAVLAAGRGAVLGHRAAASVWGILRSSVLEAIVPTQRPSRPGLLLRCCMFQADEITEMRGIPVTGISRTLFDLASVVPKRQVERAMHEAEIRGLTDRVSLPDILERYPGRPGTPTIKAILEAGITLTRSDLEAEFIRFLDARNFERPEVNAWILARGHWYEADCLWRAQRLIVELDSRAFHDTTIAFEHDRARDRRLHADGWHVIRVTWRQLRDEPEALAHDLRAVLSRTYV